MESKVINIVGRDESSIVSDVICVINSVGRDASSIVWDVRCRERASRPQRLRRPLDNIIRTPAVDLRWVPSKVLGMPRALLHPHRISLQRVPNPPLGAGGGNVRKNRGGRKREN